VERVTISNKEVEQREQWRTKNAARK